MSGFAAALFPERPVVPKTEELVRYFRIVHVDGKTSPWDNSCQSRRIIKIVTASSVGYRLAYAYQYGVADHSESFAARLGCIPND
jgi:hypothetical protein